MTPHQIAKSFCSNFNDDGSCLGAIIENDGSIHRCTPKPKCVLALTGVRCQFFEDCVLPMNSGQWPGLLSATQHQEFATGARSYRLAANVPSSSSEHTLERLCPACNKNPLDHGKRLCFPCREQSRRESARRTNRNRV